MQKKRPGNRKPGKESSMKKNKKFENSVKKDQMEVSQKPPGDIHKNRTGQNPEAWQRNRRKEEKKQKREKKTKNKNTEKTVRKPNRWLQQPALKRSRKRVQYLF